MVAPDPRPRRGDPADVNRLADISGSQDDGALERRLGALEQRVSALTAALERRALEERSHCLAAVDAARDDLFAGLDELAGEVDGLAESRGDGAREPEDVTASPAAFSQQLDSTEVSIEKGALSAGANVVFDRMGLGKEERAAVVNAARAYFERRIHELRAMNDAFIRSQGHGNGTEALARLEASEGQLVTELRGHLSEEQAQALLPMIRSVISTPPHLLTTAP